MVRSAGRSGRLRGNAAALALFCLTAALAAAPGPTRAAEPDDGKRSRQVLWIEAELQPDTLHVHAQARYTLRLYQAVSLPAIEFHAPDSALAEIRPVGERIHVETHDGLRYRVTEQLYAIFPFASGTLRLTGGYVSMRGGGATSERRIDAPALTREVTPAPTDHRPEEWLPARTVTLTESWQPTEAQLRPGQTLRRTIRIEATGVTAAQIPPLRPRTEHFTLHPEPPRLEEREEDGWITGIREQTWRLVPRQAGELTIPPLRMAWWDAIAGQKRETTLPARTVTVVASSDASAIAAGAPATPAAASTTDRPHASTTPAGGANAANTAAALLAAMTLLASGTAVRRHWRATATLRTIRRACRANDPVATRRALLQWSREIGAPRPACLLTLANHIGGAATTRELAALDRQLYGKDRVPWNSRQLVTALYREHPEFHPWRLQRPQPESIVEPPRGK